MRKSVFVSLFSLAFTAGCGAQGTPRPTDSAEMTAYMKATPSCSDEVDCQTKWHFAEDWIEMHAQWPVKRHTDNVIELEEPKYRYWTRPHYRITRKSAED